MEDKEHDLHFLFVTDVKRKLDSERCGVDEIVAETMGDNFPTTRIRTGSLKKLTFN